MSTAYLNDQFIPLTEARISPMDRGFLFGDSVYEVIPVYEGKAFALDLHLSRLEKSLELIALPLNIGQLKETILELIAKNISELKSKQLYVYLQISRGSYEKRDHAFLPKASHIKIKPTIFMYCSPLSEPAVNTVNKKGITAILHEDNRWHQCNVKSTNLLPNTLAKQSAIQAGADDAILVRNGQLMEGSASNLFVVIGETIATPPESNLILSGITRTLIIELAKKNSMSLREENIPQHKLPSCSEVWLTSSTKEILPVTSIDNNPVGNGQVGPVFNKISALYKNLKLTMIN